MFSKNKNRNTKLNSSFYVKYFTLLYFVVRDYYTEHNSVVQLFLVPIFRVTFSRKHTRDWHGFSLEQKEFRGSSITKETLFTLLAAIPLIPLPESCTGFPQGGIHFLIYLYSICAVDESSISTSELISLVE